MKKFKRSVASILAFELLATSIAVPLAPKRAEAAIAFGSLATPAQPGVLLLGFAAGVSTAAAAVEFFRIGLREHGLKSAGAFMLSALNGLVGWIILEAPNGPGGSRGLMLVSLSDRDAAAIGLSAEEHAAYEADLPLLNALMEESLVRTLSNEGLDDDGFISQVGVQWNVLTDGAVDPRSVLAVRKIADRIMKRL